MPSTTTTSKPLAQATLLTSVARRAQTQTNARISLDIGYHTCVAYDGQQVSTLRSVYAKLPIGQKAPTLPNTFTIQFGGDRYLAGAGALTQRNYLPFANEDKLSAHLLKMALYALLVKAKSISSSRTTAPMNLLRSSPRFSKAPILLCLRAIAKTSTFAASPS